MWFEWPNSGKIPHLSLSIIFFILTCCVASFGKIRSYKTNGSPSSQLAISSVEPNTGPTAGGTTVTIVGAGFWHSTSVSFGGVASPAVTFVSSTELQATTPARAGGTVAVTVTGWHNQSATLAGAFTYSAATSTALTVSAISPSQGPTDGGTTVSIAGTGFQTGATVAFGGVQSTAVSMASSTQINAVSPPGSSGTVAVTVTESSSQSASLPSAFTYTSGPSVSSVSPQTGPVTGGTTVTIMGSGFQSGASVAFGGLAATSVMFVSSSEIQAVTPVSQAGTVSVSVANQGSQTGTLASAFTFYHTVSIAWTGSTSSVAGYNVYRSSTSGGSYAKINSSLVSGTSFIDDNVQAGHTYFYVTTAVSSNNVESVYSNQAEATVPSP